MTEPEGFGRAFAAAWVAGDGTALAALVDPQAVMLTLTGLWCEGAAAMTEAMEAERAGALARARLVTGRGEVRWPRPDLAVAVQRLVVSGVTGPDGATAGRVGAVVSAVLVRAASVTFAAVEG
ncbi:MAG TPA: DUF4440 domain-containing protein [Paracoccaceae bacterium]|nr:DUF4440 domain-containing protein [Paracoccaceae bacterium]